MHPTPPPAPPFRPTNPIEFVNWVGRQIQRTFFNRTPVTRPIQYVHGPTGEIVGTYTYTPLASFGR